MTKLAIVLVVLPVFFSCASKNPFIMNQEQVRNPVIAHRGAFKNNGFPENSVAALKEAIRLQCAGSEFDVRMTADDSLIVNHDADYRGLEIERSTFFQLSAFPLANGERIPTLREYLLAGKENNKMTLLVLEIKPSGISKERGRRVAEKCVAMVRETGTEAMTIYISFDYDILKRIHEINPSAHTQYLNGDVTPEQLKADGISGADYNYAVYKKNPDWIQRAKNQAIILNAWTVNNRSEMEWLLENGFEYITTNEPELLFALWNERRAGKQ